MTGAGARGSPVVSRGSLKRTRPPLEKSDLNRIIGGAMPPCVDFDFINTK